MEMPQFILPYAVQAGERSRLQQIQDARAARTAAADAAGEAFRLQVLRAAPDAPVMAAFHMGHQVVVPDDLLGRKGVYMGLDHCHTCFLACLGPARKLCGHGNAGPAPVRRETGRRHGEAPLTPAVPVLSFLEAGKVKKDAKKCFTKAGLSSK